ncbi:uncharacterized protein [Argopecten irradians]|uniref:uncharacterized protein n=1 Tax=Argopecten irradians TaxID=31199 RepID=UPI00371A01EB
MNMLGTLDTDQKRDWKRFLGPLTFAYNSTRHDTTGYSPFQLMFGRQPRLPIDLIFGLGNTGTARKAPEYVKDLRKRMSRSFEIANRKARDAQQRQKATYDLKARHAVLDIGDRVLVKILAFEGRHKLSNRWESSVYVVVGQDNPDIPVYQVRKEDGGGKIRTLHRNHLLPVGSLPTEKPTEVEVARPCPAPRTRRTPSQRCEPAVESVTDRQLSVDSEDDSDDMGEDVVTYIPRPPIVVRDSSGSDSAQSDADEPVDDDAEAEVSPVDVAVPLVDPEPLVRQRAESPDHASSPRRSTRERKPPSWLQSGDFVCRQACLQPVAAQSEWERKASFLLDITARNVFSSMPDIARDTLLHILKS